MPTGQRLCLQYLTAMIESKELTKPEQDKESSEFVSLGFGIMPIQTRHSRMETQNRLELSIRR
jgi:hypothetical protein